ISWSRSAPMRLVPFSYFCTCWKVSPMSLPSSVWLISSIMRRIRTRLPTCLSVELGGFLGMTDRLQPAVASVHYCLGELGTKAMQDEQPAPIRLSPGEALRPHRRQPVPSTPGTEPPKLKAPPNACDCHMHIYNSRFAAAISAPHPEHAHAEDYRLFQKRIGTTRNVIVTPSTYGTDNGCTLDALA